MTCLDNFDDFYDPAIKQDAYPSVADHGGDNRTRGMSTRAISRDHELLQGLFQEQPIDLVIHLAAMAGVRPSIERPLTYSEVNIQGTLNLLGMLPHVPRQAATLWLIVLSLWSAAAACPLLRTMTSVRQCLPTLLPNAPVSCSAIPMRICIVCVWHVSRFFTVYGPYQRPDLAIHKFARLMTTTGSLFLSLAMGLRSVITPTWMISWMALSAPGDGSSTGRRPRAPMKFSTWEAPTLCHCSNSFVSWRLPLGCTAVLDWQPDQPGDVPIDLCRLAQV